MLPTFGIFLKMLQIRTKNQKKMPYNIGNNTKFSPAAHREYQNILNASLYENRVTNCKKIIIFEFSTEKYFLKGFVSTFFL